MTQQAVAPAVAEPARSPIDRAWAAARVAVAALILIAVLAQLQRTLSNAAAMETPHGSHLPTVAANFFSFFTIESNVASAVVLLVAAVWTWRAATADRDPQWLAMLLASVTTYMIVTGIVYNLLLRGVQLPQGATVPWSNEILHVIGPVALLADLLIAPRRRALGWGAIATILVFPLAWVGYTMLRANTVVAPATGNAWWYPYPFLDPHSPTTGGALGVALYVVGIAAAIALVAWAVVAIGRRRAAIAPIGARQAA
ncbi:Pr6Pr family membrane protein [Microbacterium sp. Root53]|uniref:Pr6Pr family membrane protein n=1 Tax=Microbacterium sp. Root53 TaxID=1736553 RepID=UPI000AD1563F|nr:Pr6Pr family membrane protein [Microbacterium sp. Root53]